MQVDEALMQRAFNIMDRDGDGQITREELQLVRHARHALQRLLCSHRTELGAAEGCGWASL